MMGICFPWGRNAGAAWAIESIYLKQIFCRLPALAARQHWHYDKKHLWFTKKPINTSTLRKAPCSPGLHKNADDDSKRVTCESEGESNSSRQIVNPKEMARKSNESVENTNKSYYKVLESQQSKLNNW